MKVNIYPVKNEYGGDFMNFCVREARHNLPQWYKESNSFVGDPKSSRAKDKSMTVKKCIPVLDFLSTGLTLHLPFTIYSTGIYPNKDISENLNENDCKLGTHHPEQLQKFPISSEYDPYPLKIDFPFSIEAPDGYSAVFIGSNPYKDWPLYFIPGIVETDKYKNVVNFPFVIKKDFEGKIDAGTEFMKVFFIKREDLELEYKKASEERFSQNILVRSFGAGFYKKLKLNKIFNY